MKKLQFSILFIGLHILCMAQINSTIGGIPSTGSTGFMCMGGTITNPGNINTTSTTDYTDFSVLAGVGCSYWLQSTLSSITPAGHYAGFHISSSGLADVLSSIRIKTYLGGVLQETASGAGLLSAFKNAEGKVYFLSSMPFDAIRIEFTSLAGIALHTRIYYGFSDAIDPAVVLPVYFHDVRITPTKSGNTLTWKLDADESIDLLTIEKSKDAQTFSTLAIITINRTGNYTYTDNDKLGKSYYRVSVKTRRGKIYQSPLVVAPLHTVKKPVVQLSSGNTLLIKAMQERTAPMLLIISDASGRIWYREEVAVSGNKRIVFPWNKTEIYFISLSDHQETFTYKLYKNNLQ